MKSESPRAPTAPAAHTAGTVRHGDDGEDGTLTLSVDDPRSQPRRPRQLAEAGPGSEAWILTDCSGTIVDTSLQGARLLSGSRRGLQRRNLIIFFDQDRDGWRAAMDRAAAGERVRRSGRIRPKERRPVLVAVEVARAPEVSPTLLIWSFEPSPD